MASTAKSGTAMKQGKLSFASTKNRATAAGKANIVKASPSLTPATSVRPASAAKRDQGSRSTSISSAISINTTTTDSTDDDAVVVHPAADQRSMKRRRTENEHAKGILGTIMRKELKNDSDSSSGEEPEDIKVLEKNPRIQRLYNQAKVRMGDVPPVHAEKQNKIHHILRVFDTSYEYGPCIGMTRLQRWERAHALGLNPPPEVRDLLTSKQGLENDTYKQCVFYDDV